MHFSYTISLLVTTIIQLCSVECISQTTKGGFGVPLPILYSGQGHSESITDFRPQSGSDRFSHVPGPGALRNIPNPNQDKGVKRLIEHHVVLSKVQKETNADSAIKIETVLAAHKQVASGMITYLDLKIYETLCPVGIRNANRCKKDISEDPYVCEVAVWERPWLNSTRIIDEKSKCAEIENDTDFKNWGRGTMPSKIEAHHLLGSLPNFLSEKQVAMEAYDYIDRGSDSKFKGKLVSYNIGPIMNDPTRNVTIIETKIEYGFTYCLRFPNMKLDTRICPNDSTRNNYICSVTVISAPTLTTNLKVLPTDDDDIRCDRRHEVDEELVVPIAGPCLGCPQTAPLNSPAVLQIADFALNEFDRTSDEDNLHLMVKLIKAQTQVVAGIKYLLTLELAETVCKKALNAFNMNRTFCERDFTEETKVCDMSILEQPWVNSKTLLDVRCKEKSNYPGYTRDEFIIPVVSSPVESSFVAGRSFSSNRPKELLAPQMTPTSKSNPTEAGTISPSTQKTIDDFVLYFNQQEDFDDGYYKLLKVHKASVKTERGEELQSFVIELGETICRKDQKSLNCPLKPGEDNEICSVEVGIKLDGSGKSSRTILSARCDDADEYVAKSVPRITRYHPEHNPIFNVDPASIDLPGGPHKQLKNSSSSLEIANFVVEQFNLQEDEDEIYILGSIINIYSQVAGNLKYMVELELLETKCKKYQPVTDISLCPVEAHEDPEICQAEIVVLISRSGEKQNQLVKLYCDDKEDFYIKKMTSFTGHTSAKWAPEDFTSTKAKKMGNLIADEFDARSDKDHIFVLHRILDVKTMETSLKHHLKVELAETVCPKYKRGINKTRCVIDIGEDLKICEADIVDRPWRNDQEVLKLVCYEKDDSGEGFESREILYRKIHPTAHARPRFLSIFTHRESKESDESNEKFYRAGGKLRRDSDESFVNKFRTFASSINSNANSRQRPNFFSGTRAFRKAHEAKDSDSRSHERTFRHRSTRVTRQANSEGAESLLGGAKSISGKDEDLRRVVDYAVMGLDKPEGVTMTREVVDVLAATRKVVQGYLWKVTVSIATTQCPLPMPSFLNGCVDHQSTSKHICTFTIHEVPWMKVISVKESICHPES